MGHTPKISFEALALVSLPDFTSTLPVQKGKGSEPDSNRDWGPVTGGETFPYFHFPEAIF
jgi:hypothetical protein